MTLHRAMALGLTLVAVLTSRLQAQTDDELQVGQRLSPVVVHRLGGGSMDLGEVIGKAPVLIEFWASWCPSCRAMLPRLKAAHERYGDRVRFIGINVTVGDTPAKAQSYMKDEQPPFQPLWDDEGTAARAWSPSATSYIIIADSTGTIVYTGVGGTQNLEPALARAAGSR